MASVHIIPVPAASKNEETVVLEVRQTGSAPLDVRIAGSEGEYPFVATLKQRNINKIKRKFKGSDDEWEAILSYFLLQKQPEEEHRKALDDINMVYAMDGKDAIQIILRRDVKGIKMTLGEISLTKDEDFEINPFNWAQIAAESHALAVKELAAVKSKIKDSQDTIDQLNKQLEDFLSAKRQTEDEMLEKFKVLLNEKKKKIRDQQRLLATAKVDRNVATAVESIREGAKARKAGPSRASKRKAAPTKETPAANDSDVDQMDAEPNEEETDTEEEEQLKEAEAATPDRSDEETEDEGGEEEPPKRQSAKSTKASARDAQTSNDAQQPRAEPPPRRELPFGKPGTRNRPARKQPTPPPPAQDDDEETEDEEDEL